MKWTIPSFRAITGKSPLPRQRTACYLHELANGADAVGEACPWCLMVARKGKHSLRATVRFNC